MTILGPGGMGKSRLVLAAGHAALDRFPDGVFLVELTPLTSASELARAISDALRYPFQNDPRPPRQQLTDYLRGRKLLLLLDNFEHLLDGVDLLVEMLQAAPGLRLLVTSRERLRLQAETVFRLNGLDYPTDGKPDGENFPFAAAHLFIQSAQRAHSAFALDEKSWSPLLRICRLVGGMPLGLILAASWTGDLTLSEIADELAANVAFLGQDLRDLDPRHRTIQAVFEQSWQRLTDGERQALAGFSIFQGGFDRSAAQAVTGASLPLLSRLVDRSLLWRVGEGRYDLHELVRQLACQKLVGAEREKAVLSLHSRWFLGLVFGQEKRLKGPEQERAIQLLERERENVRTAWVWAAQNGESDPMQQTVEALGIFHNRPGQWEEGEALMERAATALGEPANPQARLLQGWLLAWHGVFLHRAGKPTVAQARMAQALALVGDSPLPEKRIALLRAFVYLQRGGDLMTNRRRGQTAEDLRQALGIYNELNDDWWTVHTLVSLGILETFNGPIRQAMERLQEARQVARQSGNRNGEIQALERMSFAAEQMGQVDEGVSLAREALAMIDDPAQQRLALNRLAFVLLAAGRFEESVAASRSEIDWARSIGIGARQITFRYNTLARGYLDLGRFAEARKIAQEAAAGWKELYGWEHPFVLRSVAMGALALGDAAEARALLMGTVESQQQMGNENLFALSGAFVDCAYPALALRNLDEARQMLADGLRLVQRGDVYLHTTLALPAAALLLAEEERLEDAAYLYDAIQRYPCLTTSRWYATVALDRLAQLLAPPPPDVQAAAQARGRAQDLPGMTAELLALLA